MALKKAELYSSLWKSCDELRGGMDASQYKNYVLTLLFLKYISDKAGQDNGSLIDIPAGCTFADIAALKNDKEIGDKLNQIIAKIAAANDLQGVIDQTDFNDSDKLGSGKDMVDRLSNLVGNFEMLDLAGNKADGDDLLGDAYEYLMRHFATESGKSKGQFYTPAEVSRLMAKIIGIPANAPRSTTVYDPTCGSGSLLLKAGGEAEGGLSIYGQENDNATVALAKMNMILHGEPTAEIKQGNTIASPKFLTGGALKTFDFAVANPPFSNKNWMNGIVPQNDIHRRFDPGIPPEKNGDYAFLLHIVKSLKSGGKGAVILPHGVLFRGNAEARIRENLLKQGIIKGIIGLPANLFYGTGIPACIIVIDKAGAIPAAYDHEGNLTNGRAVFMIDAGSGYIKDGNKNRLRHQDIHKIADTFNAQKEIPHYSRLVPLAEIVANDCNLNIPRYIAPADSGDAQDLEAHLYGGIPNRDIDALADYWHTFPNIKTALFAPIANSDRSRLQVPPEQIKTTIYQSPEYTAFARAVAAPFATWRKNNGLAQIRTGDHPKTLIHQLGESLLAAYTNTPLTDPYDIYQILMDYSDGTLADDLYLICRYGWDEAKKLETVQTGGEWEIEVETVRSVTNAKGKESKKSEKTRYRSDLIPAALLTAQYFAAEQEKIDALTAELEQKEQEMESLIEEHGGEDGLLAAAQNDKGKITQAALKAALKNDPAEEEKAVLQQYGALLDAQGSLKAQIKTQTAALHQKQYQKYAALTEAEIQTLLVEHKWHAAIRRSIEAHSARTVQRFADRIATLAERYAQPLGELERETARLDGIVKNHLKALGLEI
jgi:type I restriction-modification enzyme subunit M